jgi:hypothetical protein
VLNARRQLKILFNLVQRFTQALVVRREGRFQR